MNYNGKAIIVVGTIFFAVLAAAIIGRLFKSGEIHPQKDNWDWAKSVQTVAKIKEKAVSKDTILTPQENYQIFYQLVKEKIEETRQPGEILGYINRLKAVSAPEYLKYCNAASPQMRALRAAARRGIKKALQEAGLKFYPNA